jgi:GMP synthase (glutamine-hydrolysing)
MSRPRRDKLVRVLVLQHDRQGGLGAYERVLSQREAEAEVVELDSSRCLPDWRRFDAIMALGGQASIATGSPPAWLADERQYVREAVTSGVPYWGVCLGAQLLASSLGARVYQGSRPEVGIHPVFRTESGRNDPVFSTVPPKFSVFQWHADGFELPSGAVLLADSLAYPNQAFRWGAHAYGIQFHLEISAEMVHAWAALPAYAAQLDVGVGRSRLGHLLVELEAHSTALDAIAASLLGRWLTLAEGVVAPRRRGGRPAGFKLREREEPPTYGVDRPWLRARRGRTGPRGCARHCRRAPRLEW